jgi:hypothetical protein
MAKTGTVTEEQADAVIGKGKNWTLTENGLVVVEQPTQEGGSEFVANGQPIGKSNKGVKSKSGLGSRKGMSVQAITASDTFFFLTDRLVYVEGLSHPDLKVPEGGFKSKSPNQAMECAGGLLLCVACVWASSLSQPRTLLLYQAFMSYDSPVF